MAWFHIVQRNWRGDIDDPKSKTSKRPLTLGDLAERYRVQATADKAQPDKRCTPSSTPFAPMPQSPPTGPLHALHQHFLIQEWAWTGEIS